MRLKQSSFPSTYIDTYYVVAFRFYLSNVSAFFNILKDVSVSGESIYKNMFLE